MDIKIGNHCAFNLNYHIVFCPKRRKPVLVDAIAEDCKSLIQKTATENGIDILALEVMPDHVHVFLSANPVISPCQIVKRIKASTAIVLRDKYPQLRRLPCLWAGSYYIGSVGSVSESVVKLYIENQKGK